MNRYKESQWTPIKQRRYSQIVNWSCAAINAILKRHSGASWIDGTTHFIDTTSGPGQSFDGKDGSPLILLNALHSNYYDFPAIVDFIDIDSECIESLMKIVGEFEVRDNITVNFYCEDNRKILERKIKTNTKWKFGLIYNDPSGEIPNFDEISSLYEIAGMAPCDIVINCPTTTINRIRKARHCTEGRCLTEFLNQIPKNFWFFTEPVGKHKWTMMLGTNWDKASLYGDFHRHDSKDGTRILKNINYTKKEKELKNGPQRSLWPVDRTAI